jgi:hypothetical protein
VVSQILSPSCKNTGDDIIILIKLDDHITDLGKGWQFSFSTSQRMPQIFYKVLFLQCVEMHEAQQYPLLTSYGVYISYLVLLLVSRDRD